MGKLWMEFKKYVVVFDMFKVQKRLRNGHRYGFVRFKNINDVDDLYKRLCNIRIGRELLKDVNDTSTGCWKNEEEVVRRTVEVRNDEVDTEVLERSLIAEVKKLGYLAMLSKFCQEEGLINVEVKVLGGMEVMLVFDIMETACNILCDTKHGLRRWIHKVHRWNVNYSPKGRITWINILGVPVTCWTSSVFRRIAEWHGTVLSMSNCSLSGNQNIPVGKVGRQRCLRIKIKEPVVNMKEQGGGVESVDDDEDEDKEEDGGKKFPTDMGGYEGCLSFRKAEYGDRKEKEREGSRASSIIVKDSFEGQDEITNKEKAAEMPEISVRNNINRPKAGEKNETQLNVDEKNKNETTNLKKTYLENEVRFSNAEDGDQKGTKRDDAPPNYNSSGGDRCTKKRKTTKTVKLEGTSSVNCFSHGVIDESDNSSRRAGSRTMNLAKKAARQKISQVNDGVAEVIDGCFSRVFKAGIVYNNEGCLPKIFKGVQAGDMDNRLNGVNRGPMVNVNNNVTCDITDEEIREVGEQIGIKWDANDDRTVGVEGISVKDGDL
ncbi:transposon TX1 [Tanacetum coccineum]